MRAINVRVPVDDIEAFRRLAESNDRTFSRELRRAMRIAVESGNATPGTGSRSKTRASAARDVSSS